MGGLKLFRSAVDDGFAVRVPLAVWRFDGNSGLARASAGFPCTPGLVTAANLDKVRFFVDGVEQAIAIDPANGKHPDGSYRSVRVQFRAVVSAQPRYGEVRIGSQARTTTDLAWIEPTYGVPGGEDATNWPAVSQNCVFAVTDPEHLCNSYVALQPLQPASEDSADAAAYFGLDTSQEFGEWIAWLDTQGRTGNFSGATYEHVHALQEAYCRTGDPAMYERAHKWLVSSLSGNYWQVGSGAQGAGGDNYTKCQAVDPTLPEPASDTTGLPPEQNSGVRHGWATGYLLSGWKQPWRLMSYHMSWGGNSATFPVSTLYGHRFNMQMYGDVWVASYLIEANMQVTNGDGGYGPGRDPAVRTFAAQLPAILTALETHEYAAYGDGYADGIVGQRQTITTLGTATGPATGGFETFQLMCTARPLIRYYQAIAPDARIPVWIKTMADFIIGQSATDAGDTRLARTRYEQDQAVNPTYASLEDFYIGFFPEIFGFAYAFETDPTDKETYRQWLLKAIYPTALAGFGKTGKAFGQYFGAQQSAAYYLDGGAVRGITGAHPTVITEPALHTS